MIAKISTLKFELNTYPLPLARSNLPFRFAIRETGLNGFDQIAKLFRHHAEKENHSVFINWRVPKATEINWITIGWAVGQT